MKLDIVVEDGPNNDFRSGAIEKILRHPFRPFLNGCQNYSVKNGGYLHFSTNFHNEFVMIVLHNSVAVSH